jgi:predicted O-methyltransferase YrrM
MWWRLVCRFQPKSFLEIGVYRGQTISLVSLLARMQGLDTTVTGISPFSSAGDSVSKYGTGLDYKADTLQNFAHFKLPPPELLQGYSTDASAVDLILSRAWDIIYIDGNHDYDIVVKDWEACSKAVKPGGLIILDDSGLSTSYRPPAFATGGHPGPSRLATEIDPEHFQEILQVGHNRVFQHRL